MDEFDYDEGSDIDNWETEQVFRDREGDEDDEFEAINADAEDEFRDAYEAAFGVRPAFDVDSHTVAELQDRTESIRAAFSAGRFV